MKLFLPVQLELVQCFRPRLPPEAVELLTVHTNDVELHRKTMCGIIWAYCGPLDKVEEAFRPVRKFRTPRFELTGIMPYTALQSMFDALYPPGMQWFWKGDFLGQIPDEAIDEHLKFGEQLPTLHSTMHFYPVDGAASRVDRHETAFSYRDAKWSMVMVGIDPDPANAEKITAWTKDYWEALHPYSLGGAYVNFMMSRAPWRVIGISTSRIGHTSRSLY